MSVIELKELKFERESEFESILINNPNIIEEGLKIIDTQIVTSRGPLDILGVDSGNVLVIIELKIVESDEMLWQALDYYDWVFMNIDSIKRMYQDSKIEHSQEPRLMLIAPTFSDVIQRRAIYLEAPVELLEYKYLQADDKRGILLNPVSLPNSPADEIPEGYKSVEDHVKHITDEQSRELCRDVIERIKSIGNEYTSAKQKISHLFLYQWLKVCFSLPKKRIFLDKYLHQ